MEILLNIVPAMGIALCAIAVCQVALWSAHSVGFFSAEKREFEQQRKGFRSQLQNRSRQTSPHHANERTWRGYRDFRVDRLVKETDNCTSVYLIPDDGKPLAHFKPGQHLTFRFQIPGQNKPIVRCYSLSDGPGKPYYRISVKEVAAPRDKPELRPGKVSLFVNRVLTVGMRIEVKAPAGEFYLNEDSEKPVILLAGGVGITPMVSMIDRLIAIGSQRLVLLAYGIGHGPDHVFKNDLNRIAGQHENIHVMNCYSTAQATDQLGVDYQVDGRVSVDLLKQVLPHLDCEFYLCGPPGFMKSVYEGLLNAGVPESEIRFEAFGPASIGKPKKETSQSKPETVAVPINFANSETIAMWDGTHDSLLECAEANDIQVDSGCRAGSCGSCSTQLISGNVEYPDGQKPECEAGHCLMCIARPRGPIELGA